MPTIQQGFARILQYGNFRHKEIIKNIQCSAIRLIVTSSGGSGNCGLYSAETTQKLISSGAISYLQAFGELELSVHPLTASTYPGLEGTLIHETRHAHHQARAISEMSHGKKDYYNPNGFEIEYSANVAYVEYVKQAVRLNHPDKQAFINEAVNSLGIAKKVGNNIVINEAGIRNRLWTQYGTNDTNQKGTTFSDHWRLKPRVI